MQGISMSTVKIEIKSEGYEHAIGRTAVYVDGKFVYQSGNAVAIEHEHLQKLVKALQIDNTEVISFYK